MPSGETLTAPGGEGIDQLADDLGGLADFFQAD